MKKNSLDFSEILRNFLRDNSLTQQEFAETIEVKQSLVSEWLKGKAKPGYVSLKKIARAFDISANFFLGITDTYW